MALAQAALEKTRIRAPADGTVLQVDAKKGELAIPTVEPPLAGARRRVGVARARGGGRAESRKVKRRPARPGARRRVPRPEFDGKVRRRSRIVGPGRINSRNPRKFNDVDVLEVVVDLRDPGPLVVGEQVDVYFSSEGWKQEKRSSGAGGPGSALT